MPTLTGRNSLLTTASVANVFLGSQYELAPFDGTIEIGCIATLVSMTLAIFSGPDVLAEPGSVVPFTATERFPNYPDDYHWEDEVAAGDRLKLGFTNGNANTNVVNWSLRITPA